jgi:hypothetical protein
MVSRWRGVVAQSRPGIGIVVSIVVVAILVSVVLFQGRFEEPGIVNLNPGTKLNYSITGATNNTTISGWRNYTIETWGLSSYSQRTYLIDDDWTEWLDYLPQVHENHYVGLLAKSELIETPFGMKYVRTHIDYFRSSSFSDYNRSGLLIITCVGWDTSIVYQVTAARPGLHYTIKLAGTSMEDISLLDTTPHLGITTGCAKVQSEPSRYGLGSGYGGGMYGVNSLEVLEGQRIRYNISGEPIRMYFMSLNDLAHIEDGGDFSYIEWLSLDNCTGEVDAAVAPGTYWFIEDFRVGPNETMLTLYWMY